MEMFWEYLEVIKLGGRVAAAGRAVGEGVTIERAAAV